MYYPEEKEFRKLSRKGNLIPVYREILSDMETPVSAFKKLDKGGFSYLLESVERGEILGRYSFLGTSPSLIFMSKKRGIKIIKKGETKNLVMEDDPLKFLRRIMNKFTVVTLSTLPLFSGGMVGYIGYDVIRFWEDIPEKNPDELNLPDSFFTLSDTFLIFDHLKHKIKIVSYAFLDEKRSVLASYKEAKEKIDKIITKLKRPSSSSFSLPQQLKREKNIFQSNFTLQSFTEKVKKAKKYIKKGDIFQVVLSQRFKRKIKASSFNIYRSLRSLNPSPYMYYLRGGDFEIIGSSPEIFVRKEGRKVSLRPIAGTRYRGKNAQEDKALIKSLLSDPKERAEHTMLVDLGRNDLGRVCTYGTVKTTELFSVEKYSHVMHLVSNIEGKLKKGMDQYDLLQACFPAGTVSGAPKVRAMEIIDELENCARGPYAGALGYFSFSGNMDTCIIIRTIIVKNKIAYIQAGAGIVADSSPEKEYQETLNKAGALFKAIELAEEGIE
ncbi:anthranilate synthase component I [Candidatus Aerophobetes bacterium]|nr:anthranilate synthase component I [Candidatus Aerophobetes bacterium]